ncbi:hypothetical protein GCM10025853_13930 [Tetragenococcus halophilus subsp. halophilus DSM 20339]|nr:hypothetical protein GCM10025853_13930 [Tetragenococcus halophilus subsp. halophilus DSM 20339]
MLEKSGIGRAFEHQKKALESAGIDYTTDARSKDYDILHINTYGINSRKMIKQAKKQGKKLFIMRIPMRKILRIHSLEQIQLRHYIKNMWSVYTP